MTNMTLTKIAEACNGHLVGEYGGTATEVAGVVLDSRLVQKDYLFIATVGERVDGHDFIEEVFAKGALAVVCEKAPVAPKGPYILVKNSLDALKRIAIWYRNQLEIKVVGITGSVGKTSTKEFISSVLSQKYKVLKTEGNFNNEVGLPLTILKIRKEHQVAVLEMGISDFGEMHRLSEIAKPDICVITNIGQCHLENLGSRLGVLKAKSEIFDFMKDDGSVVINGDDDMLATLREIKGKKPLRFGLRASNDIPGNHSEQEYMINDVFTTDLIPHGLFGTTCDIHVMDRILHTTVPQPGEHMVLNALAATSVGSLLDMTPEEIAVGISVVQPIGGRSNIIRHEKYTIIDDCYNANPVSMKAAIDLLTMADTRRVAFLGDMFELGSMEKALHKEVGEYAAAREIDLLVCVGTLSHSMYEGAKDIINEKQNKHEAPVNPELIYYETRDELISALPTIVRDNDTILVKASHGMGFENLVKALL